MVHKGEIMGIRFYGEATEGDLKNLQNFANKLEELQQSLSVLFNADVAEKAIRNTILSQIHVEVMNGIEQHTEILEELYQKGILQKTKARQEHDNKRFISNRNKYFLN